MSIFVTRVVDMLAVLDQLLHTRLDAASESSIPNCGFSVERVLVGWSRLAVNGCFVPL
jgi:hypothetical protein